MPFPKDKLVATEYQPFDNGQPPVQFGERTGIQSVITSPWVLRWASIPATYATYRQIRKLGTIAMAREIKVASVLAAEWTVEADDDAPDEWKTLVEKVFFPLRDEFMAATLYYGQVDFGYTCFEKVIEPKDGYLKIVRFKPLLHDITEICIGHKGGFIGVRQLGKDLGIHNSLHVGFGVEGSYLYGTPLLENARQAYNWWVDCNEGARRYDRKIAGAHIVVEYPLGSSLDRNGKEVENAVLARTVLDSLESAGGVAVPRDMAAFMQQLNLESPGWKIWILDAGSNQQGTFVQRLEYLDKQLCRSLHIPERSVLEGQHGTLAEAESHMDVVFTIQDIEHRRVTSELNRQAVDQLLFLNFGRRAVGKVRLKASPIVDEKKGFFKEIYAQLLASPAGQRELQSLDAGSLREQLGLPQIQNDPGDVEHEGANLQAVPGLSAGTPGGEGKGLMAQGPDGQPVTVPGEADNPATALANAIWGMRDAIALSSTALAKAEQRARAAGGDPLELAGSESVEQPTWEEDPRFTKGDLHYKTKSVPLGGNDYMNFEALGSRDDIDPDVAHVMQEHGLGLPHEVLFGRGPKATTGFDKGRFRITGEGKAGAVLSHTSQALRELVDRYRPVSIEFSADEPSRQKAYHHMMRRLAGENIGNGEYTFLHEPEMPFDSKGRRIGRPAYYHIVHQAAADLPRYQEMEPIGSGEKVSLSGTEMSDVLSARPIAGRLAENMNSVAMTNAQRLHEKGIAPAIDAPNQVEQYISPGMAILMELRARRGAARFANDPPAALAGDSGPEAEYIGHGPTQEGQYGISYKTPEGEVQHLGVKGMRPIESGESENRLMHVTFHNGSEAKLRMPEQHRKEIISNVLARMPKLATASEEIARKRAQMMQESQAEGARRTQQQQVHKTLREQDQPKRKPQAALRFEMPEIPYFGSGEGKHVAAAATETISNHFLNDVVPLLTSHHAEHPDIGARLASAARQDALGKAIAGSLGKYGEDEVYTNGHVDPQKVMDFAPPVYSMVLKDAEKWHPGLKEEVKDKASGAVHTEPVDFQKYVQRSIWRATTLLTRGERFDPNAPKVEHITKAETGGGGDTVDMPVTQADVERRLGENISPEDEARRELADQWMGAHLDQAGMQVYQARLAGEPLDNLRKKYGDEAVNERHQVIDQLLPYFQKWVASDYAPPSEAAGTMPTLKLKTPAENRLPIKRTAGHHELMFLKKFTAGMDPVMKQAAETLYFARRSKLPAKQIVGHAELPEPYRYARTINPLSARMTKAAQEFDKATGRDVYSKIKYRQKGIRTIKQPWAAEREHHAGIENFMRAKLADAGYAPEAIEILKQTLLGTTMPKQLDDDKELIKAAEREHRAAKVGKPLGVVPKTAHNMVRRYVDRFRQWLPDYFESVGKPELAQAYRDKNQAHAEVYKERTDAIMGRGPKKSIEQKRARAQSQMARLRKSERDSRQKATINREALQLETLPAMIEQHLGRTGVGRQQRDAQQAKLRTQLAMHIIRQQLEGAPMTKIAQQPQVRAIIDQPGFFRQRKDAPEMTPAIAFQRLNQFMTRAVVPAIKTHSPVLYKLLRTHHATFNKQFHPLSKSPEPVELE